MEHLILDVEIQFLGKERSELDDMCKEAGCLRYEALPEVEERSAKLRQIEVTLKDLDEQLLRLSAGATVEEFVQDSGGLILIG